MKRPTFTTFILIFCLFFLSTHGQTDIQEFIKEIEEPVGRNQSQEQVEAFALQKAKRLALEETGTYLSSLTVVRDSRLTSEQIIALAGGIVKAKIVDRPEVRTENGVVYVKVKARIEVDTAILKYHVEELIKNKKIMARLEELQRRNQALEDQLAALKGTESRRLEELNATVLALEKDRERQRLFLEEQRLRAEAALKDAEIKRLEEVRAMQERLERLSKEQKEVKQREAELIAKEKDRILHAQLENEARWKAIARKAERNQAVWIPIDETLSAQQALEETIQLKETIRDLIRQIDSDYQVNREKLIAIFDKQIELTKRHMPPISEDRKLFEKTWEYNQRITKHEKKVAQLKEKNRNKKLEIEGESEIMLTRLKFDWLTQKVNILEPFIKRLQEIQKKKFFLPNEKVIVTLDEPNADKSHFPLRIEYKGNTFNTLWHYKDVGEAKIFWDTREYLQGEGLFQIGDEMSELWFYITDCHVINHGTKNKITIKLRSIQTFREIEEWENMAPLLEKARLDFLRNKADYIDSLTDMKFVLVPKGCYYKGCNNCNYDEIIGSKKKVCVDEFFIGKYEVTQGQWRKLMGNKPRYSYKSDSHPVVNVGWEDMKEFIRRLNEKSEGTYRLPTETEWEYACRSGGKAETYCGSNDIYRVGWCNDSIQPRGTKDPNGLGIHDMSGNVWELCEEYKEVHTTAMRGGDTHSIDWCKSTSRRIYPLPSAYLQALQKVGFRLLRTSDRK